MSADEIQPAAEMPTGVATRGRLKLDLHRPVREAVAGVFRDEVVHAERVAALGDRFPAAAVHEFRRSLRRARALTRLLRGALPKATHDSLDRALGELARQTSTLRDAEILPAALASLEPKPRKRLQALADGLEQRRRDAYASGEAARVLAGCRGALEPLPDQLTASLPAALQWDDLAAGLRESFRRARRARDLAKKRPQHLLIHDWRKRVKDLRHQVEALTPDGAGDEAAQRVQALQDLAKQLGVVTDVIVLRQWLQRQGGQSELREMIGKSAKEKIASEFDAALRASKKLFKQKSRTFGAAVASDVDAAAELCQMAREVEAAWAATVDQEGEDAIVAAVPVAATVEGAATVEALPEPTIAPAPEAPPILELPPAPKSRRRPWTRARRVPDAPED